VGDVSPGLQAECDLQIAYLKVSGLPRRAKGFWHVLHWCCSARAAIAFK
jgi:hypothetical protein